MTITREQLELAALAAGHKVYGWCVLCDDRIAYADIGPEESVAWRPHTYIADAARLAVRMRIMFDITASSVEAFGDERYSNQRILHDGTQSDAERAYCEAITMCAAKIGRKMKEAK